MEDNGHYLCCKVCYSTILKKTEYTNLWSEIKKEVWERDGGKCIQCGSLQNLEVKRIISTFKGGKNIPINLKLICNICKK